MRKIMLVAALLSSAMAAQAAGPKAAIAPPPPKAHALVGVWQWTMPGKACTETLDYRADGTWHGKSGEEITQGSYAATAVPSLLGFYRVAATVSQSNGQADCAGDRHEVSEEATERYVQLSPKLDLMLVCKTESLQACYGPLRRTTSPTP